MDKLPDGGWGSHKPLLQALIDVFKPYYIMELGIGIYSTPILSGGCVKYVGVEQDLCWIKKILSLPELQSIQVLRHESDIKVDQRFEDMPIGQIDSVVEFYTMLKNSVIELQPSEHSMLFVDNYTGCRTLAINTMFDGFDIICYHDSEAVQWYNYKFNAILKDNYDHYTLMTNGIGTSVFIKKSLSDLSAQLKDAIQPIIKSYAEENNIHVELINFKKD
jgi:hypothetical protein